MKKTINIAIFFILIAHMALFGKPVSIESAKNSAIEFYKANTPHKSVSEPLNLKIFRIEEINVIALFTFETGGFVAISLFDEVRPLLAYSFSGNLDLNNIPDNANSWYLSAGRKILEQSKLNIVNSEALLERQSMDAGSFIVNTQKNPYLVNSSWGQGCHFNQYCPADINGPCGRCLTGCVATAMAQIMYYWQYPQFGTSSHSYQSNYGVLSANFGETEYMWANMTDTVTAENTAVATLMYHLGVAVEMNYTSSASSAAVPNSALQNYFSYSQNQESVYMSDYSTHEWIDILKNEIDHLRPVLYVGFLDFVPVGHAWVCDGYDSMDYFHFNWGQNGDSGGFYEMGTFTYPESNHAEIKIMPVCDNDIKVSQMISPFSQTFTQSSTLKVRVENYSSSPQTNIPIAYSVNNGTVFNEVITATIPALSSLEYEFSTPYDFSLNPGIYEVKIFSNHPQDAYRYNDTIYSVIENISCTQVSYSTGFENAAEKLGWIVEDANNDGNSWQFNTFAPHYVFYSSNANQADDWLFSRCLELQTNKLYRLKFDYRSIGIYWKQNFEIWLGSGIESSEMNVLLDSIVDFNNADYETKEILFTVPANSSYYLGFRCLSQPEMLVAVLDNISIIELTEPDFEICSIVSPYTTCELSSETIRIKVRNLCSQTLSNIPISYVLDDAQAVSEVITDEILPGEILFFDFSNQADISSSGSHALKVYSSLDSDSNRENDTVSVIVDNIAASYAPYFCGFESLDEYKYYLVEDNNNDNHPWKYVTSGGNTNPGCVKYEYNDFLAADDWLITKCIYLENNYIYKLKFAYKIEDASWPEKLEVKMSDIQSSSGMDDLLIDLPLITNSLYETAEVTFPIPMDGFYYFGFHCYSDVQMFNLYLDDISIDVETVNELGGDDKSNIIVYPNPANDVINLRDNSSDVVNFLIQIYDTRGKKVFEKEMSNPSVSIDISNFEKGVYVIKINKNATSIVKRIIKL
ncbi:MAG: C10 family peptidase [Bacteroidales bacterium]|nr:C10 family peptidase [Bacteroidales bacterium]MDY0215735.1 C10 family peptidase [Bacteroidales bacterium]